LAKVKKNEFLLQKDFLLEAKHVEFKMANPLKDEVVRGEEEKIQVIKKKHRSYTRQEETNELLLVFLSFFDSQDPSSRALSIRMLERELATRRELGPLLKTVKTLSTSYCDKLHNAVDKKDLELGKEQLLRAKSNLIENSKMVIFWPKWDLIKNFFYSLAEVTFRQFFTISA
jgi:hypothetical protein